MILLIEEIDVRPDDFHKSIWIPHCPVVKTDANMTTKIRPVFNCSLKTNKALSLNEAAYAGVNLMKDIVKLSIFFRSNKYEEHYIVATGPKITTLLC